MDANSGAGIVTIASHRSVDGTVEKLEQILQAKGVKLFALIDHSGEALKAGMQMRPTKLLIFGNPKAGTPLMIVSPSIAIDLPLKILVSEDGDGKVWISYNDPAYLQARHSLPADLVPEHSGGASAGHKGGRVSGYAMHPGNRRRVAALPCVAIIRRRFRVLPVTADLRAPPA